MRVSPLLAYLRLVIREVRKSNQLYHGNETKRNNPALFRMCRVNIWNGCGYGWEGVGWPGARAVGVSTSFSLAFFAALMHAREGIVNCPFAGPRREQLLEYRISLNVPLRRVLG